MVYCIVGAIQYAFNAHASRINYKMKIKIKQNQNIYFIDASKFGAAD